MSFSVFRAPLRNTTAASLRRVAIAQAPSCNRVLFRNTFSRKYSTPPPQAKSGTGLYIGVGAVVALGLGYYYYDTVISKEAGKAVQSGIPAKAFVPTKEDYIKVDQSTTYPAFSLICCALGVGIQQNCPHH